MPKRKEMFKEIKVNFAKINRSYSALLKEAERMDMPSDFADTQRMKFGQLTGALEEGKIASGKYATFTNRQLEDLIAAQRQYLRSNLSTVKGRQLQRARARATFNESYGTNYTQRQFNEIIRFFARAPRVYHELNDGDNRGRRFGSDQIEELLVDEHYRANELVNALLTVENNHWQNNIRTGQWRPFLRDIMEATRTGGNVDAVYEMYRIQ